MAPDPHILVGRYGRVAVLELGSDIVEHAHPQAQGLIKIDGPDRTILVAGRRHVLRNETMVLLRPWIPHGGLASVGASTRVLAVNLDLPYERARRGRARAQRSPDGVCHCMEPNLREAADYVKQRLARGEATAGDADELLRCFSMTCASAEFAEVGTQAPRIDFRIRRVIDHIRTAPTDAQNVDVWVKISGLSRPHFFHLFRQCTGVTPRLYANSLRLEYAIDRLSNSSMPIHSVAESLGFRAPSHFTRFFLHHLGSTPRAYRHGVRAFAN
ncbi:MAG TPA: AraC family transcriptional regulator [Pseudolabrys sp.]|jgi:AraC family transcriptional regulator